MVPIIAALENRNKTETNHVQEVVIGVVNRGDIVSSKADCIF